MPRFASHFTLLALLVFPHVVAAQALINPLKVSTVEQLLGLILAAVVQIGSILLVLALVYVGFLFVMAQGNTEQLKKAREALVWTVIGGIVLLGAQAIALVVQSTVQGL